MNRPSISTLNRSILREIILKLFALALAAAGASSAFLSSQTITTVAGFASTPITGATALTAPLGRTSGVAVDNQGNIYIADTDNNIIVRVRLDGSFQVVAGNGLPGFSGDGNLATAARLSCPCGLTADSLGNLFVADSNNNRVRKISTNGVITTVAGSQSAGFSGDNGPATAASLSHPTSVAFDSFGNLFIADSSNNRVRIVYSGIISTVAGGGTASTGTLATQVTLETPTGIAVDGAGNLFIAETGLNRIRKVTPSGIIATVAGNGVMGISGDGGQALAAYLAKPSALAVDATGSLFIVDTQSSRIRKVSPDGVITRIAGGGSDGSLGDGGAATAASLSFPAAIAVDAGGRLFIADTLNQRVRSVDTSGVITTVAGNGNPILATQAPLRLPAGVTVDSLGNLYISDTGANRIRKVSVTGVVTTVAGTGNSFFSGDGGPAASASISGPRGVAVTGGGELLIADSNNSRVRKVNGSGVIITVAGTAPAGALAVVGDGGPATAANLGFPAGVAIDPAGNFYIADSARIRKVLGGIITTIAGTGKLGFAGDGGPATAALLYSANSVALDTAGNFFIADMANQRIRKISADGVITTVAGNGFYGFSGDGGPATAAMLRTPSGVALDAAGNLYIADTNNHRIRRVSPNGVITTVVGSGKQAYSGDDGPATAAAMDSPNAVAVDAAGNIYIADTGNNLIRKVSALPSSPAPLTTQLSPSSVTAGGTAFTLGVSGSNFISNSTVQWNGSSRATTFVSSTELRAAILAADITAAGTVQITVVTPAPGGGASAALPFTITANTLPAVNAGGTVSAASFSTALTPGSIASVFGVNLAPSVQVATSVPLPASLAGVSVKVGGFAAPLFFISPAQINLILPWELAGQTQVPIIVTTAAGTSTVQTLTLGPNAPGIFTTNQQGNGQGAVLISNTGEVAAPTGSISGTAARPANRGEFISIYCSGLGRVTNQPVSGAASPAGPLATTSATTTVTIGGVTVTPSFSGLAPGFVGLYQINVAVPDGITPGDTVSLTVTTGAVTSNTVTIAVQ